jgi:uncharacterized protein (TIGR03437 family)
VCFLAPLMAALGADLLPTTTSSPLLTNGTAVYGATLTYKVTVVPTTTGGAAPTGTVTFTVDGNTGTPQALSAGIATLQVPFTAGSHTLKAQYNGDATYASSTSGTTTQVVDKADTKVSMASNPAQINQAVAIRAAPTPVLVPAAYVSGSVDFTIGGVAITGCTGVSVQNGVAICNTTFPKVGTFTVAAAFIPGDNNTNPSSATLPIAIGKVAPGVWAAFSPDAPVWGSPLTLSALLMGATGVPAPTGTVTFSEGTVTLGEAVVGSDGRANLILSGTSPVVPGAGTHTIAVQYNGDTNYQSMPASAIVVAISKAPTSVTLAVTAAQIGQPMTIRAVPKVVSPSVGTPGGPVTFTNGDTPIAGCAAVAIGKDGTATCLATFTQLSNVTINATYNGDANTLPSTASTPLAVGKVVAGIYSASTPSAPVYGAPVTINVLMLGASGVATPTGNVTLSDGGATLATVDVGSDGKASIVVPGTAGGTPLAPLAVGTHSIVAVYNGDSNYLIATAATLTVAVGKAATAVALTSTSARTGQPVTLTAAVSVVSPGAATLTGTVDFTSGGKAISGCTGVALQNAAAVCTTTISQSGDYTVTANYNGDANTAASTATLPLSIGKPAAAIQSTYTPSNPVYGVPVTITALVTGTTGTAAPTGTVTFTVDAGSGFAIPVGGDGRASLALPLPAGGPLGAGVHAISAAYGGDTNYGSASATALSVTVAKAATSISMTASYGMPLAATVSLVPPSSGSPTGVVQFFQNGAAIGTASLSQVGNVSIATFSPPTQGGNFWAVYQGDNNCISSASQLVAMTTGAQVSISADHNPSSAGQPVVFTIQVTGTSGAPAPTGTVQVTSDGASLGSAALTGGQATLVATSLDAGSHTILASYSGDSVYAAATATLVQVVNKSAPALSLAANPPASVFGQAVTLTAQGGTSSGTVQFLDGTTAIGSASASGGTATLVTSSLAAGTHSLTASWAGDASSGAGASPAVSLTVSKAQTNTKLDISGSTLRATVTAVAPGAGTPTGTVKFVDSSTNLVVASANLDSTGVASTPTPSSAGSIVAAYGGDGNFLASNSSSVAALTALNAASYLKAGFAPDEIVTLFGSNLSTATVSATPGPAKSLGDTAIAITDFTGKKYDADLMFVSPDQATFLMPANIASGPATVVISNPSRPPLSITITVTSVAPGLFTLNATGDGVAAAQAIRVRAGGIQDAAQDIAIYDKNQAKWMPMPIDLGDTGDTVYLLLYGTGLRHYAQPPVCTIGSQKVPVAYAGAQGGFPGVDQINLVLPRTLRGAGVVNLTLTVDGVTSNTVTLAFQ